MKKESQEVSLLDIWRILAQQKKIIFLTWVICVALGLVYVVLATPVYKAEVFMLPPSQKDIQPLNIAILDRSGRLSRYSTEQVYQVFVQTLKSRAMRRSFYDENQIAMKLGFNEGSDSDTFFENNFNQKLKVVQNVKTKEEKGFVSLSFETKDSSLVDVIANNFIDKVANATVERLVNEVNSKIFSLKSKIRDSIEGKKTLAKTRRQDRIIALQEALSISHVLKNHDQQVNLGKLAVNTEELPLYMIDELVLQAEIDILKAREDDAPFIKGLRDLEENLAALEQVNIEQSEVEPVFVDQKAWKPNSPIRPKKTLVLLLFGLSGLLLGVVVAVYRKQALELKG